MVYPEYEQYKSKYLEIQSKYNEILLEKENLFTKTQPNAITYDKDKVQSCNFSNSFDDYVIEKEKKRIDERLKEAKHIVDERLYLLRIKEIDLRQSRDKYDRVYVYKYIDGFKIYQIAKVLNYSQSQVYRMIERIEKKDAKKCEKICDNIESED